MPTLACFVKDNSGLAAAAVEIRKLEIFGVDPNLLGRSIARLEATASQECCFDGSAETIGVQVKVTKQRKRAQKRISLRGFCSQLYVL